MELKRALTFDEQIKRLTEYHGLSVDDIEEAKRILNDVSYYRLSAYGIGLKKHDNKERYIDGISLNYLFRLYSFDSDFKNVLIHSIERIEVQFRTRLSNFLALRYGSEGYTVKENFNDKCLKDGSSLHRNIIDKFQKEVQRQTKVPFVKHHIDNYDGRFPIWVAVELFTFGHLVSMYDIMKREDQADIARYYDTEANHLRSWLIALVEVRNICAHYLRLYNLPLKQTPFLYKEDVQYRNRANKNKIFVILLVIKRILQANNQWTELCDNIERIMDKYNDVVNLSYMGFPNDWKMVLSCTCGQVSQTGF